MALITRELPVCDICGEEWLPKKGPARDNPRMFAERCGKCKNPKWDYKHVRGVADTGKPGRIPVENMTHGDRWNREKQKDPAAFIQKYQDLRDKRTVNKKVSEANKPARKKCRHGLLDCKTCQGGKGT